MKITVKNEYLRKINYIGVFLLLYFSSSFYALSINGAVNLTLLLSVAIIIFFVNKKSRYINRKPLFLVLLIVIGSLCTMLVNGEGFYNYLIFWTSLLAAYLIFISIDFFDFVEMFTNIMYFLCFFSLVTFLGLLIAPNLYTMFPKVTNNAGLTVHNVFFSVVYNSNYFNSNFGLFWEPGAYQTFINLAIFFQLFVLKDINYKRITILLITILTTFSTTGYIAAFLIITIFFFSKNSGSSEYRLKKRKIISLLIVLLIVSIYIFSNLPNHIKFKVFGKLEAIINPDLLKVNAAYASTTSRINALKIPIINWIESPFFGVGFTKIYNFSIDGRANFMTATPLNWFGLFGLPLGIILNYCMWKWSKVIKRGQIQKMLIFAFLLLIVISEYYNRNAFYLAFLMYGLNLRSSNINND